MVCDKENDVRIHLCLEKQRNISCTLKSVGHRLLDLEKPKPECPLREQPQSQEEVLEDLQHDTECQKRLRESCSSIGLTRWRFRRAPEGYYEWSLEQRKNFLLAHTTSHLCKTMLLVNTRCEHDSCADRLNSKYYLIVVVRFAQSSHS